MRSKKAIVIGTGVVGLTSGLELLKNGWSVLFVSDKRGLETLSSHAPALWLPFHCKNNWKSLEIDSFKEFLRLARDHPKSGVRMGNGFVYSDQEEFPPECWMDVVKWRKCVKSEIPQQFSSGIALNLPLIEMPVFLDWLESGIQRLGGKFESVGKIENVSSLVDHPFSPDLIVACPGLGACDLFHDQEMEPIRGQLVKIKLKAGQKTIPNDFFFLGESTDGHADPVASYIIPRMKVALLGGIADLMSYDMYMAKQSDPDFLIPDEKVSQGILQRYSKIQSIDVNDIEILGEWVGIRPGRSIVRLEEDKDGVFSKKSGRQTRLIYNYGHGGGGVSLCFGCANATLQLANGTPSKL